MAQLAGPSEKRQAAGRLAGTTAAVEERRFLIYSLTRWSLSLSVSPSFFFQSVSLSGSTEPEAQNMEWLT